MGHKRIAALVTGAALLGGSALAAPAQATTAAAVRPAAVRPTAVRPTAVQPAAVRPAATLAAATSVAARALPARCRRGRVVCVSKTRRKVYWVVNGSIKLVLDARFGARRTPTREGVFRIYFKDRNHVSHQFGSKMPFALFFSGGQAVHYSSDFARRGYAGASHGCVNTRNWTTMASLFAATRVGDRVVVYRG